MILQQQRMTERLKCRESAEVRVVYIRILATPTDYCGRESFISKLVCDYAVAIVVVCRDIPTLSLVDYICR